MICYDSQCYQVEWKETNCNWNSFVCSKFNKTNDNKAVASAMREQWSRRKREKDSTGEKKEQVRTTVYCEPHLSYKTAVKLLNQLSKQTFDAKK